MHGWRLLLLVVHSGGAISCSSWGHAMVVSFNNGVLIGGNGMPWLRRIISLKHATCKSTALPSKWMWYLYAQNLLRRPLLSPEVTWWQISRCLPVEL